MTQDHRRGKPHRLQMAQGHQRGKPHRQLMLESKGWCDEKHLLKTTSHHEANHSVDSRHDCDHVNFLDLHRCWPNRKQGKPLLRCQERGNPHSRRWAQGNPHSHHDQQRHHVDGWPCRLQGKPSGGHPGPDQDLQMAMRWREHPYQSMMMTSLRQGVVEDVKRSLCPYAHSCLHPARTHVLHEH